MAKRYGAESVNRIMSRNVPSCQPDDTQGTLMSIISSRKWTSVHNVYVLDELGKLLGLIHIDKLLRSPRVTKAEDMMVKPKVVLHPGDDQEAAVFEAIKNDIIAVPVTDEHDHFVGAVTAWSIIDVMHDEHAEDALITAGIKGDVRHVVSETTKRSSLVFRGRAPWLIFGLGMGLLLALISRQFDEALQQNVAIAYFIPVIAYIAGAVGTQSGAIAVRALATIKVSPAIYVLKEFIIGIGLGILVGILGGIGAFVISQSGSVALAVGLSLVAASVVSSVLAAVIPIAFKALGKDPALGSGPLATALQDVISIIVYFSFATWLVS